MLWWSVVFLAIFLIGLTKSGFGSGAGLMIVPMMALAMGRIPGYETHAALALMLPLLIAGDLIAVYQYRSIFNPGLVKRLLPGTVAGVVLGSLLLRWFVGRQKEVAEALINLEIGLECILLVGLHWYRVRRAKGRLPPYRPSLVKSTAVGAFAGVSSTLAHAAGPIIALHLLPQRLDRRVFVGTCALYFFLLNSAKLPGYYAAGLFEHVSPPFALRFLPLVVLGALFGFWVNKRIRDELFSRLVYVIAFVLGWYILAKGVWGLRMHWA